MDIKEKINPASARRGGINPAPACRSWINKAPDTCGVYIIKDAQANIIYIGKATSIRKRLKSHFAKTILSSKQHALIESARDIDYIPTSSPEAALLLEAALIKRYSPKYNAALKDDKSYPALKLTINEDFPRLSITRRKVPDGSIYFGPYTNAKLLRKALKLLSILFPLRRCKKIPAKPCLDFHIGQCLAPCIDKISKGDYRKIVENLILFLEGKTTELQKALIEDMDKASKEGNFELAARIRDQIKALKIVTPHHSVASGAGQAALPVRQAGVPISAQMQDLAQKLSLPKPPLMIEAFDASNIQGKEATGSVVVFKDGKPAISLYRKFKIKTVKGIDDYSMIAEVVGRRYSRLLKEKSPLPDLIIIDGGKGHLLSAKKQLRKLGIWQIPVIAIAKRFELIYAQENKEPLGIDPTTPSALLIQRIRDEAHRFAINYHRLLRGKNVSQSELDNIPGIGMTKKKLLLEHFGSVDEIKMAELGDLAKVKYINEKQARQIYDYFNSV